MQATVSAMGEFRWRRKLGELARRFVERQVEYSCTLDARLPATFQVDGNREFVDCLVGRFLSPGQHVYDVGGGKNPVVGGERKRALGLSITGIDIDAAELESAPAGVYDETICSDISRYRGKGNGDLLICQALLEHVADPEGAVRAIASILKPGGRALLFVPCRNAVFARINLLLPQTWKRRLLFAVFPEMSRDHGFPAYYRSCTPSAMRRLCERHGLECEREWLYYRSDYFRFCFPLHALWRAWLGLFRAVSRRSAAETFTLLLRKSPAGEGEK